MINPNRYFIIVDKTAEVKSGLSNRAIRDRICAGTETVEELSGYPIKGRATVEDDGTFRWVVVQTKIKSPGRNMKNAFVVDLQP